MVNVVYGKGDVIGKAMAAHPIVKALALVNITWIDSITRVFLALIPRYKFSFFKLGEVHKKLKQLLSFYLSQYLGDDPLYRSLSWQCIPASSSVCLI